MTSNNINKKALNSLLEQNWEEAQKLFFENAKRNPSHETYNNLGNYLIEEGLICKNGYVRNAQKLGLKYLLKAAELKESSTNLCAISKAYNCELQTATKTQRYKLYKQTLDCLKRALTIKYSDEIQYNYIRILCLIDVNQESLLEKSRSLVANYVCQESVLLYFELLRVHSLLDEGLRCIEKYRQYLTEIDLLMFFVKFGLYEKAYCLCDTVCKEFSIDKYIASAIIECCIHTQHFDEAMSYAQYIQEIEDDIECPTENKWYKKIFINMDSSDNKRQKLINDYLAIPPFVETCCYYGCSLDGTDW